MKKITILLSFVLFSTMTFAQSPIPNGSFEHWDSLIVHNPTGYQTSNLGNGNQPNPLAPANVTQGPAYHGNYGVTLTTTVFQSDTGFAYITNSANNPAAGQGGIPYNQKATGFRIYYKCNVMSHDTAGIMIVFKKSGNIIGIYYYPFIGTTGSYTLYSKTFTPALPVAPDSVIFAATSSNAIFGGTGKPGSTLTIDSLTFTGVASQPAMLNGDFENWVADSTYSPTSWFTYELNSRTTDKLNGNYALELVTAASPHNGGNVQSSMATTGKDVRLSHNDTIEGGNPYSINSDSIIFYYKYTAGFVGDSGAVMLQFNKNSHPIFGLNMNLAPTATWKRVSKYFNMGTTPDSVIVYFQSSYQYNVSTAGSILKVDSVKFYSQVLAGIPEINSSDFINIYPNPTTSAISIDMGNFTGKVETVSLYDISGKQLNFFNYNFGGNSSKILSYNLSNYPAGFYILRIQTTRGIEYKKISKI